MDAATERRDPQLSRIPFEGPIELYLDGYDEGFTAEGVDLGLGGIALRSSVLPDVGSRLMCRFGVDGEAVEVPGEVVWAALEGPRIGSFGLRFEGLSVESEASVAAIVDDWHRGFAIEDGVDSYDDDSLDEEDEVFPAVAQLELEGVGGAIEVEVVHRADDAMMVEQELPFLRLDTIVRAEGRAGQLKDVSLRLDGDTPRLVFTLWLDDEPREVSVVPGAPTTMIDEPSVSPPDLLAEVSSLAEGEPESYEAREAELPLEPLEPVDAFANATSTDESAGVDAMLDSIDEQHEVGSRREDDASRVFVLDSQDEDDEDDEGVPTPVPYEGRGSAAVNLAGAAIDPAELGKPSLRAKLGGLATKLAALKVWVALAARQLGPRAKRVGVHLKTFAGYVGPKLAAAVAFLRAKVGKPTGSKQSAKRTTARPGRPRQAPKAGQHEGRRGQAALVEPEISPDRKSKARKRAALVAGALTLGAGLAFATGGDDEVPAESAMIAEPAEVAATPAPAPTEPSSPVVGLLEAGDDPAPVEPAEVAVPEPAASEMRQAGRIPRPSFPTLQDATRPPSPGSVPADSPYAAEAAPRDNAVRRFGAENLSPRYEFRLRLNGPHQGLRGEETEDGFIVHFPNVQSRDRAARIASVHPRIAAAEVENDDDGAHLRVTFREGRRPEYRIDLAGSAIRLRFGR